MVCRRRLFAAALLVTLLAAATSALAAEPARQPVQLQLWTIWGGERIPLMEKILSQFEETYPWIKVEHVLVAGGERFDRFIAAVAAGAPPDVMMLGRHEIPFLAQNEMILPLDAYMEQDGVSGDIFFPSEFATAQWNGQTYILPMPTGAGANGVVFYNKDLFAQAGLDTERLPETWREFEDLGRRLNRYDANGSLIQLGIDVRAGGDRWFISWLHSNNGEYASADGRRFLFNSPEGKEAVEWVMQFTNEINGGPAAISEFTSRTGGSFPGGQRAMIISGVWQEFIYLTQNPSLNLGVGLIPHNEGAETWLAQIGGWGYSIPRGVKHPYESWLLTKWLTTSEVGAFEFLFEQRRPSPVREFTLDPRYFDVSSNWLMMIEAMQRSKPINITPVEPQVWLQLEPTILSRAWSGQEPASQVLDELYAQAQRLLDEYWAQIDAR